MVNEKWLPFLFGLIFLLASGLCGGCVVPQIVGAQAGARSALEQGLISTALRRAIGESPNKKVPFEILEGMKVLVEVTCISRSGEVGGCSEDARFVESLIAEKLLEAKSSVARSGSEDAVVKVIVDTLGTDATVRIFPHQYLPLFYWITYNAKASITLYAYDAKGKEMGMLLNYQGKGEESKSEWAFLVIGPFK